MTPSARQKREAIELAWIALAYHEAALRLAEAGVSERFDRYRYLDLPALNLYHHCAELLYKAALNLVGVTPPRTHNLAELEDTCATHCPTLAFTVPKAFGNYKSGMDGLFGDFEREYFKSLGLRYRYPGQNLPDTIVMETDWPDLVAELTAFKLQTLKIWRDILLS